MVNPFMFKEDQNPFEILGIAATFSIDPVALDKAYFARQSLIHPDRFVYHTEPERQVALLQSSLLNRAYETLKTPTRRAKALLRLRGIRVSEDDSQTIQDSQILADIMALQETLTEAVSPHDLTQLENEIQDQLHKVEDSFSRALHHNNNDELLGFFLRLTYLSKLQGDIQIRRRQSSVKVL